MEMPRSFRTLMTRNCVFILSTDSLAHSLHFLRNMSIGILRVSNWKKRIIRDSAKVFDGNVLHLVLRNTRERNLFMERVNLALISMFAPASPPLTLSWRSCRWSIRKNSPMTHTFVKYRASLERARISKDTLAYPRVWSCVWTSSR